MGIRSVFRVDAIGCVTYATCTCLMLWQYKQKVFTRTPMRIEQECRQAHCTHLFFKSRYFQQIATPKYCHTNRIRRNTDPGQGRKLIVGVPTDFCRRILFMSTRVRVFVCCANVCSNISSSIFCSAVLRVAVLVNQRIVCTSRYPRGPICLNKIFLDESIRVCIRM